MSEQPPSPDIPTPLQVASHRADAAAKVETGVSDAESSRLEFGRVDDEGRVFVRTRDGERQVGQWPGGDTAAALAFYSKRYDGLVVEVDLLVRRVQSGSLPPDDAAGAVAKVRESVQGAAAVGDLYGLVERLDSLAPRIDELRSARRAERAARSEQSKADKERIVADAEKVATGSDWRGGANRLRELLEAWKALPRIDRPSDDELWHRFSAARTTYTRRRKQHFAELNSKQDEARAAKNAIIAEAEALSDSTDWGPTSGAYRDLMSRWKAAGSAGRDVDDALWKRFRAAQDVFFSARDAAGSKADEEQSANAAVKRELLQRAERLLPVTDPKRARQEFREIAERWDAAGKVPRADMRDLEGRFRTVETQIRGAEDDTWRRTNPEVHARASETVLKLEAVLAGLQSDLEAAEARGDKKKVNELTASIEARQQWLDQARRSQSEFRA